MTVTHTAGVLVLGLALTLSASLAGEAVLGWLRVASGILIAAVGAGLLTGAIRGRHAHGPGHTAHHSHGGRAHTHGPFHGDHDHDHRHDPDHDHHDRSLRRVSRRGLGMGIAGGPVPSPSALVVLLAAVALGRTAFGVLVVLSYGLGMAGTLTVAELLLVRVRDRLQQRSQEAAGLSRG